MGNLSNDRVWFSPFLSDFRLILSFPFIKTLNSTILFILSIYLFFPIIIIIILNFHFKYQTILALELRDTALETFKLLFMAITKSLKPLMNDMKKSSSAKFSESLDRAINANLACLVLMEKPENRDKPVTEPVCIGPNPNSSRWMDVFRGEGAVAPSHGGKNFS